MDFHISIKRFFPFLNWPRPTATSLRRDIWAGFSVGLVLIPQSVAYATLAGMPPQTGLYAALLPSVIGILWGSSALLAVGPVALTSLLVSGSLYPLAVQGSAQWVALAIWLSLYAGLMQFLLGAFRLGRIANLVSQPVVAGFINAAAVIIIVSQLPALFGVSNNAAHSFSALTAAFSALSALNLWGLAALMLLIGFKRYLPSFPGILIVTVIGIGASWLFDYASLGGQIVGALPAGLPPLLPLPSIAFDQHRELLPAALIVALISFTEAMSSCRTLARKRQQRWDENQELIGQGLAKITSAFSGAFPVSGSFSRSALNLYAGAVTGWSTLFSALCVLLSLMFLTDLIAYLPRPVLAAMIIVPVFGLVNFSVFRRLLALSKDDGAIAIVTFSVTLLATPRLHWGVFAGVGLTMVSYLYRHTRPRIIEVGQHPDGTLRDRNRFDLPPLAPDLLAVRMDAALNFLTGSILERFIVERCHADQRIRRVLFCAGSVNDIDASGIDTLESLRETMQSQGISLYFSNIKKQVWDVLDRAGMIDAVGRDHIFTTDSDAISTMSAPVRMPPET
jgi:SulP family sulfate permease